MYEARLSKSGKSVCWFTCNISKGFRSPALSADLTVKRFKCLERQNYRTSLLAEFRS